MVYTGESILSCLRTYATRCQYEKENGEQREYLLTAHPLGERDKFYVPKHPERITVWDAKESKWRFLRPEGVTELNTTL